MTQTITTTTNKFSTPLHIQTPIVMGVLNITPDSFHDGGRYHSIESCQKRAFKMVEEGAHIIDIGGESTRPGAKPVSENEEMDRVLPVIEAVRSIADAPISIDTSKPVLMREAVLAGAIMVNDVRALEAPGALETVATLLDTHPLSICLMHMQGAPQTMQHNPQYGDVIGNIKHYLDGRVQACLRAGIPKTHLILDPGFGFGKTVEHNLQLIRHLNRFKSLGCPLLLGISRKSTIGALLNGAPTEERLHGSIAAATLAVMNGANIIRTHDVKPTVDAIKIAMAVREPEHSNA